MPRANTRRTRREHEGDSREPFEPSDERGQGMDQQQHLQAPTLARERVLESAAVAVRFKIAEGLLDLHAAGIEPHDLGGR